MKLWLDDVLNGAVRSIDFLLHLLTNISTLPVTKEMVTTSKLGKHVAAIEKHKICVGSPNESAIKERISKLKELWSASVKSHKSNPGETINEASSNKAKRPLDSEVPTATKKLKTDEQSRNMALSNLIKKASGSNMSAENSEKKQGSLSPIAKSDEYKNKSEKRITWADTRGLKLSTAHETIIVVDGNDTPGKETNDNINMSVSWSDQKKRDRQKEKELLLKARKSKLVDKDDSLDSMVMMYSGWYQPKPLPPDLENPPVQVTSNEVIVQSKRIASVLPVTYSTEEEIPLNPTPLSEQEVASDMLSQSSSIPSSIRFFVAQEVPVQAPLPPAPGPVPQVPLIPQPPPNIPLPIIASVEVVQSLGLPLFLVGQNIQALQTLAASPGLLNAFVDASGNYDQIRILNLVQTITQNITGNQNPNIPSVPPIPMAMNPYGNSYQPPPQASVYAPPPAPPTMVAPTTINNGYRGDQNGTDGNLHVSGYGPSTTPEAIIALFSPYVKVDEIVPKSGFMFVNTSDPEGAKRAKEALNGVIIGGSPLRINLALRRAKNPNGAPSTSTNRQSKTDNLVLPRNVYGQIDYDAVRDDRGNPATKNLFVAGFGVGTTERDLEEIFNQHTVVTGIVLKGSFAFVNTSERNTAIHAREALTGAVVNGGVLRINFAKESGRLGTSFDTGYASTPVTSTRSSAPAPNYYGRGY
jgi:RNA recognition motif-containing protein